MEVPCFRRDTRKAKKAKLEARRRNGWDFDTSCNFTCSWKAIMPSGSRCADLWPRHYAEGSLMSFMLIALVALSELHLAEFLMQLNCWPETRYQGVFSPFLHSPYHKRDLGQDQFWLPCTEFQDSLWISGIAASHFTKWRQISMWTVSFLLSHAPSFLLPKSHLFLFTPS